MALKTSGKRKKLCTKVLQQNIPAVYVTCVSHQIKSFPASLGILDTISNNGEAVEISPSARPWRSDFILSDTA